MSLHPKGAPTGCQIYICTTLLRFVFTALEQFLQVLLALTGPVGPNIMVVPLSPGYILETEQLFSFQYGQSRSKAPSLHEKKLLSRKLHKNKIQTSQNSVAVRGSKFFVNITCLLLVLSLGGRFFVGAHVESLFDYYLSTRKHSWFLLAS